MSEEHNHKTLLEIHEDVPANHYDQGIKRNAFQKYWHWRRFTEVLKVVKPATGPILDIGCHSGTFTSKVLLRAKPSAVYGVDVSHSAIKLAKKRIPKGYFEVGDGANLPYKNNFFEAVFCLEVLEHVDDPVKVVSEVKRVLQKNGVGIFLVPTDNQLFKWVWFLWTMYYPVWRHAHIQSFSGKNLENVIKKAGLKIETVKLFNFGMLKLVVAKKP